MVTDLRRRREAALRLPPLPGGHRDPLDDPPGRFAPPSGYSLSHAELAAHVRQLRRSGWQHWEINTRFDFTRAA